MTRTRHVPLLALTVACVACSEPAPAGVDIAPIDGAEADPDPSSASSPDDGEPLDRGGGETGPALTLISDATCENPCTFQTGGGMVPARVAYRADGWDIGESTDADSRFAITYDFYEVGERLVEATAYTTDGRALGSVSARITVVDPDAADDDPTPPLPDVPYFYQYANTLHPSASCQNTVIAMVLASRGWRGSPDVITEYWGKDYAQTPAGFSDLLNQEAAYWGLDIRSTARTNATFADLHALLDRGIPVPVHGYFTRYGHVLLVLGYDAGGYWVNDPAGTWGGTFMSGYPYGWEPTAGDGIYYPKAAFEAAIGTSNGSSPLPLWLHELRY